jgi:DnaJ like chaperone protein
LAYKGKIIGAAIGSVAGPLGSIIGALIGHLYDAGSKEWKYPGSLKPASALPLSREGRNFVTSLVGLSIAVAGCDGPVKDSQIEALKTFFRTNLETASLDPVNTIIKDSMKMSTKPDVSMLAIHYGNLTPFEGRLLLLRILFKIASADPEGISRKEERLIERIAGLLGLESDFPSVKSEFAWAEDRSYRILGISKSAGKEEIKKAYRRLASVYHPDRVSSLGKDFTLLAEEKFKMINDAYEGIRKTRAF